MHNTKTWKVGSHRIEKRKKHKWYYTFYGKIDSYFTTKPLNNSKTRNCFVTRKIQ